MKKATRNILIISACCMGAGVLAAAAGLAAGGWFGIQITRDGIRSASSDNEPYILKKTKLDNFSEIKIDIGSEADIELPPVRRQFLLPGILSGRERCRTCMGCLRTIRSL